LSAGVSVLDWRANFRKVVPIIEHRAGPNQQLDMNRMPKSYSIMAPAKTDKGHEKANRTSQYIQYHQKAEEIEIDKPDGSKELRR
jgi:hypothetical protein